MPTKEKTKERNYTVDFSTIKRVWLDGVENPEGFDTNQYALRGKFSEWQRDIERKKKGSKDNWNGCNGYEMKNWIRSGFQSKEFAAIGDYKATVKRRRAIWAEQGDELDLGLMYSGDPTPFMDREQRESKPGMRIVVDLAMACSTSSTTIEAYGAWVAGLTSGFAARGYDLDVDVRMKSRALFADENGGPSHGPITNVTFRLKKYGVQSDFAAWSPIFSPGGYRVLGFTGLYMAADAFGKQASNYLGYPNQRADWGLEWDADSRVLSVHCPNQPTSFPADRMTADARSLGMLG